MKRLRARYGCPTEFALEFVGGKWKTVILCWLKEEPHRYSQLRARMPEVSDKVLTQRLKDLELLGLVEKGILEDGLAAVYRLTPRGESLRPLLGALYAWGVETAHDFDVEVTPRPLAAQQQ